MGLSGCEFLWISFFFFVFVFSFLSVGSVYCSVYFFELDYRVTPCKFFDRIFPSLFKTRCSL